MIALGPARRFVPLVSLIAFLAAPPLAAAENLVSNGDFSQGPSAWNGFENGKLLSDGDRKFFLLTKPGGALTQRVPVPAGVYRIKVTLRMRVSNVTMGDQGWKDARLAMDFRDATGKQVGGWPDVLHLVGTVDWTNLERSYPVPPDAVALNLGAANFGAAGLVSFADIRIEATGVRPASPCDAPLPPGVESPWNPDKAFRQTSRTSERICINGLWAFIPAGKDPGALPPATGQGWGWFKVPGMWRMGKFDSNAVQELFISPWLEGRVDTANFDQAWYRRDVDVPENWKGRRMAVEFTMLQTHARVFVDGREVGECWFPGGVVDLSTALRPGTRQSLAVLVTARPLESESTSFSAPDRVAKSKAVVNCKGITGDIFLLSEPADQSIGDVHVRCSTRNQSLTLEMGLRNAPGADDRISAVILEQGKPVKSFSAKDFSNPVLAERRMAVSAPWPEAKRWDLDTPANQYEILVALQDSKGKLLCETTPQRFAFREFWIQGRDFYLNGKKVHLRSLFVDSMMKHAGLVSYGAGLDLCRKMQEYGFNHYIFGNYDFAPGSVGYMDGLLQAADDSGTLVGFSLPHLKDFNGKIWAPEQAARYRALTEWLIRRVQNHPSIIAYAMNHNATGYFGDQNPLKIDGLYSPDTNTDPKNRRQQARTCAAIARSIDPSRAIYHHQSGNLDDMHTVNIYLNWVPRQERSEWIGNWSSNGAKPLFFVEWGMPHISSFSSFRGPEFIWRNPALQSIWVSEFAAPFLGDSVYEMTPDRTRILADEEALWAAGQPFYWGSLISHFGNEKARLETPAWFLDDNWRSHRAWGISAMLPWDQETSWARVKDTPFRANPDRFRDLQKPGIVADGRGKEGQYIYDPSPDAFEPTAVGKVWLRWNRPLCAFIGGTGVFTDKTHLFRPGEVFQKQLVILNDTRRDATCRYRWTITPGNQDGRGEITLAAGERAFAPFIASAPSNAGPAELKVVFDFGSERQEDTFRLDVIAPGHAPTSVRIALYDPKGLTGRLLSRLGIPFERIGASVPVPSGALLVIGREALAGGAPCPDLSGVRAGGKVLFFEQDTATLMNRLGLRVTEYGLRNLWRRDPGHPVLAGLDEATLSDWRGESTLLPDHLTNLARIETSDPRWLWCGFENKRAWRNGNRGNLASVLIEKPAVGDWRPILDGGFDLHYSPLMEYREGRGRMVFCQLDVSGRTAEEPVADLLVSRLITWLTAAPPVDTRKVFYAGDRRGAEILSNLQVAWKPLSGETPGADSVVVVGPSAEVPSVDAALAAGARVLALGLPEADMRRLFPQIKVSTGAEVSQRIEDLSSPFFSGISQAELHWRTRPEFARLVESDSKSSPALRSMAVGKGQLILCQVAPWHFEVAKKPYVKPSLRRTAFLVSRLLANLGAPASSPILPRLTQTPLMPIFDLSQGWVAKDDPNSQGRKENWQAPEFRDRDWSPVSVPGNFDSLRPELGNFIGLVWYRLHFKVPKDLKVDRTTLNLGGVDDESWVWLNGKFLGEVTQVTHPSNYWQARRSYPVTREMLRPGENNVLTVLVNNLRGTGGIAGMPHLFRDVWNEAFYLDTVEAGDDPYRYYRW